MTWWVSRLCEEFHCLPSEALTEWRRAPAGLLEEVMEARAFANAKSICDRAQSKLDIPSTPMTALVQEIEFALVKERQKARVLRSAG